MLEKLEFRSFPSGLLVEKNSFPYVRSFYRGILLRKTGYRGPEIVHISCWGKIWGALPHKFLPIACGIMLGFLCPKLHTDMQTEIHAHFHNILRLIICMRKFVWLSSLSISHPDFLLEYNIFQVSFIAEPKLCLWSIPLTEKYTVGLASDLSFCWLDHYRCRIDADNQSKTQLAFWADIPYIMRLTEKDIMFSWASSKYLLLLRVRCQLLSNSFIGKK